jgi:hypothetical protein
MTSSDASEVEATSSREMFGRDIGLIAMIVVKLVISSLQAIHPSIHSRISGFPYNLFYMQESSNRFINFDDFPSLYYYRHKHFSIMPIMNFASSGNIEQAATGL